MDKQLFSFYEKCIESNCTNIDNVDELKAAKIIAIKSNIKYDKYDNFEELMKKASVVYSEEMKNREIIEKEKKKAQERELEKKRAYEAKIHHMMTLKIEGGDSIIISKIEGQLPLQIKRVSSYGSVREETVAKSLINFSYKGNYFYPRNSHNYGGVQKVTKESSTGNIVKGAAIGGIVAGPAGAVVGAIAGNAAPKKTTTEYVVTPSHSSDKVFLGYNPTVSIDYRTSGSILRVILSETVIDGIKRNEYYKQFFSEDGISCKQDCNEEDIKKYISLLNRILTNPIPAESDQEKYQRAERYANDRSASKRDKAIEIYKELSSEPAYLDSADKFIELYEAREKEKVKKKKAMKIAGLIIATILVVYLTVTYIQRSTFAKNSIVDFYSEKGYTVQSIENDEEENERVGTDTHFYYIVTLQDNIPEEDIAEMCESYTDLFPHFYEDRAIGEPDTLFHFVNKVIIDNHVYTYSILNDGNGPIIPIYKDGEVFIKDAF